MTHLADHIRTTPLADTHDHLGTEDAFTNPGPDILQDLFAGGYLPPDLIVAGANPADVDKLLDASDPDIAARFARIAPAWQHCQHTGYGEALQRSARLVYGLTEITAASLAAAANQNKALRQPGQRLQLLREQANLAFVQLDYATWDCPPDPAGPDFFLRDLSWLSLASGEIDPEKLHAATDIAVHDLATLHSAMTELFARHAPTAIAVKSQHAYNRTIAWQERTEADAARALQQVLTADNAAPDTRSSLGDWCLARGVELAIEHNLPFKIHTGYNAGHSYMQLDRVRPAHLSPLLARYPKARFMLFHTGYPYGGEVLALAKHYPNVWMDLCWAWSIDPLATATFVRRAIHTVPINKLFAFGGDAAWPTQTVGYADQCRDWLIHVLQQEIDDDLLSEAEACHIATRFMIENQREVFDIEGTAAACEAALHG